MRLKREQTLAALILLGMAVVGLASLGRWQLHRADERRAIRLAIETGRQQPPLDLSPATPAQALQPWRAARAQGVWRNDLTVLIDNRNLAGRPGLWVATPLQSDDDAAVLVLRGWLARPLGDAPLSLPPGEPGVQRVTGELASRVPRLFELPGQAGGLPDDWPGRNPGAPSPPTPRPPAGEGSLGAAHFIPSPACGRGCPEEAGEGVPRVQNLDVTALAQATGLNFLPMVLLQTAPTQDDGLLRDWPQPSVDADQNIGYAIQWFGFATIAGVAWLVIAVRALRRACRDRGDNRRTS